MPITNTIFKEKSAYVARCVDVNTRAQEFMDDQITFILQHRATTHPFLAHYSKHGLPAQASKVLYLETLHYFKYLPFYVCGISAITRDEAVLRAIAFNARDELGLSKSHADIYRDFLLKKGISEQEINDYQCLPSTQALNDGIRALYSTLPLQKALGALFADEAMSASMVAQYNDGLIKEGLSERDRSFWILHMEVEVGHSNAIFNVMEPHLESQAEQLAFVDGINQYMHLMEVYWDGIASKIQGLQHHA